jgi:hypothetical protein
MQIQQKKPTHPIMKNILISKKGILKLINNINPKKALVLHLHGSNQVELALFPLIFCKCQMVIMAEQMSAFSFSILPAMLGITLKI